MKHVRIEDGPRLVVQAWVASRVLLALIFVWVIWSTRTTWHDAAGNWDVAHFLRIARDGYAVNDEAAFFPGLPLLLHGAGAIGVDMTAAGIIASVVGSGFAAWALWRSRSNSVPRYSEEARKSCAQAPSCE